MKFAKLLILALVTLMATSCEKEDPGPLYTINDFVGSWKASSMLQTNNANSSEVIDLTAIGGELRITVLDGGDTRTWFTLGTYSDEWDANVVVTDDSTLTSTPAESERGVSVFTFTLENETLTLTNTDDEFDFTLSNETPVSSTSKVVFVKN